MYEIQFRKYPLEPNENPLSKNITTLAEALQLRQLSGDLVIDSGTQKIVVSDNWLFDFERRDPKCYVKNAMKQQLKQNLYDLDVQNKNSPKKSAEHQMCWLWSRGSESEAILRRVILYEPLFNSDSPYLALLAGCDFHAEYARLQRHGHPSAAHAEEDMLWPANTLENRSKKLFIKSPILNINKR